MPVSVSLRSHETGSGPSPCLIPASLRFAMDRAQGCLPPEPLIPAQAGIHGLLSGRERRMRGRPMDPRFRGGMRGERGLCPCSGNGPQSPTPRGLTAGPITHSCGHAIWRNRCSGGDARLQRHHLSRRPVQSWTPWSSHGESTARIRPTCRGPHTLGHEPARRSLLPGAPALLAGAVGFPARLRGLDGEVDRGGAWLCQHARRDHLVWLDPCRVSGPQPAARRLQPAYGRRGGLARRAGCSEAKDRGSDLKGESRPVPSARHLRLAPPSPGRGV